MLLRRSVTAALSPFQKVAALRSFTATVAIKVDGKEFDEINENLRSLMDPRIYEGMNNEFVEIHKQLRSLNNGLTNLRERMKDELRDEEKLDNNVPIMTDGETDVPHLGAMIQNEGRKTRSTIQDEEKKIRSTKHHRGTYHHHYLYFAQ